MGLDSRLRLSFLVAAGALGLAAGCSSFPGPPPHAEEEVRPEQVAEYSKLYGTNCTACHGVGGQNGPSIALNNPVYQALVSDNELTTVLTKGRKNMPAFAQSAGGSLTDKQISILIYGMRQHWAKPGAYQGMPEYAEHLTGAPAHGEQVFAAACASCHGTAEKPGPGGNLMDPTYLALVSDQYLRTTTIAGRPDIGQPDWRADSAPHAMAGYPLSDQDVTDVVAWIASHRPAQAVQTAALEAGVNQNVRAKAAKPEHGGMQIRRTPVSTPTIPNQEIHPAPPVNRDGKRDSKARSWDRRTVLMGIGIALNAVVGVAIAVPVIGYILGPALRKKGYYKSWVSLGTIDKFPNGQTRLATFVSPYRTPDDGQTDNTACWVRRVEDAKFQVFAVNCAHLGCPVRWFPQSSLFMCPCHGGVYYQDGSRAAGPPERGLFEYQYKVVNGELQIDAGQLPTLSNSASLKGTSPCLG